MAVPKKRTGHSAQGKRRANWKATKPETTVCSNCGQPVLAHTVCTACGYYKGQPVSLKDKAEAAKEVKKPAKKAVKKAVAKKPVAKKVKKLGKVIFEIDGQQIDYKKIEKKAAKLGGDVYVVVGEKKIFDANGKSVDLF